MNLLGALGLDPGELIIALSIGAIFLMAAFFIVCRKYDDGLIGNVALVLMVAACVLLAADLVRYEFEAPAPAYCLLIVGMAIFIVRHGYRFAMFHWHGYFGWSRPSDRADKTAGALSMNRQRGYASATLLPVLAAVALLAACAGSTAALDTAEGPRTFSGVCGLKPLGQSEEGITIVLARCQERK